MDDQLSHSTEPDSTLSWHAIYTRHQHGKAVADILSRKGFEIFLPQYTSTRQWKDRRKEISLPLFPSYVFIRGGLDGMLQIVMTPGVYWLVSLGERVAVIPQEEIDAVRRLIESSLRLEPHPFLKCGDWVRITSGPLEGVEGILVRKKGTFRLVLSVEMLQKSVAVEVDVSTVERAARDAAQTVGSVWTVQPDTIGSIGYALA